MNARSMMTARQAWTRRENRSLPIAATLFKRFSEETRLRRHALVNRLKSGVSPMSCSGLASALQISKRTAKRELDVLIKRGVVRQEKQGRTYKYSLTSAAPRVIRRRDGQYAMYCPSCNKYGRFTHRVKVGVNRFEFVCSCGFEKVIDSMEGML